MFEAHSKRRAIERCMKLKEAMIAGIWANSNYDSQKKGETAPREKILTDVEERFERAIAMLHGQTEDEFDGYDADDPFFSAIKIPGIDPGATAPEIAEHAEDGYVIDIDQA